MYLRRKSLALKWLTVISLLVSLSTSGVLSDPVNTLKIDRSFVGRMCEGDENAEIVRTTITLACVPEPSRIGSLIGVTTPFCNLGLGRQRHGRCHRSVGRRD